MTNSIESVPELLAAQPGEYRDYTGSIWILSEDGRWFDRNGDTFEDHAALAMAMTGMTKEQVIESSRNYLVKARLVRVVS